MRRPGIEPGLLAWEANVLPLDHRRTALTSFTLRALRHSVLQDTGTYSGLTNQSDISPRIATDADTSQPKEYFYIADY